MDSAMKSVKAKVQAEGRGANRASESSRHAAFKSAVRRASGSGRVHHVVDARAAFGILPIGTVAKAIAWPKL